MVAYYSGKKGGDMKKLLWSLFNLPYSIWSAWKRDVRRVLNHRGEDWRDEQW